MLNVLEIANQVSESVEDRVVLLQEALAEIRERKISDEPLVRAAVTAEREVVLGIISQALRLPASADPLDRAWIAVSKRAEDWMKRHP